LKRLKSLFELGAAKIGCFHGKKMRILLFGLALGALLSDMACAFSTNGYAAQMVGDINMKSRLSRCPGTAHSQRPKAFSLRMKADEGSNVKKDPVEVITNVVLQVRNSAHHP
jgi:hypothetical protein